MKTVKIDMNNNDTLIPLMAGALYDLHDLVNDKIEELKKESCEVEEPEEILTEIRHFRAIRNRLANYL
tara:strand:+ start:281 stop:484 length:204 start_codon:yes stop_codon:yes gene_type:complete